MTIEQLSETIISLRLAINSLENKIMQLDTKLSNKFEVKEKDCIVHTNAINDVKKVIYGNGNKTFSILYRLDALEKFEVRVTTLAIIGSAIGSVLLDYIKTLWKN